LGSYNPNGKPGYLVTPDDMVGQNVLAVINASLPEGQPVPTYHPEYLNNDLVSTVNLVEDAAVWVTFVHEGAGYRNSLGFYSYPTDSPPTTLGEISSFNIIFPNVSFSGSGGNLTTGNRVNLGSFPAGTTVGWFLVPDGWNSSTKKVDVKPGIKFSDKNLNTFTQDPYRQHIALLYDQSLQKLILGMEDIDRPGGDNDFNDAIFYVSANPFTAIQTSNLAAATNTDDDDEDGVSNSTDVEPNNPEVAFHAHTPGQGLFGSFAFEDLYPSKGDYDMNDLVVDYNFKEYLNANNEIVKIDVSLKLRAAGGIQENGFGFELGITPDKVASVTGYQLVANPMDVLFPNGVEIKQNKAVVIAFDNALQLLGGGQIINTEKEENEISPVEINMTVRLTQPVTRQALGAAPYNPFMFVNTLRGKEVHLPGYRPTTLANAAFFGSADDATDPNAGIFYKTKTGLPYAINIPSSFIYPAERVPVNAGHLKFTQWTQSGGSQFADWYKNLTGYRALQKLY
jgi:LruC domain-containing protein